MGEKMIEISGRLKKIASYISEKSNFADIGSDHAFLSVFVCLKNPDTNGIAGEVRQGPYEAARKTVERYRMESRIKVRLGDGLTVIAEDDAIDTVVIAGMGGKLIIRILEEKPEIRKRINRFILQPNTHPEIVRAYCEDLGIPLVHESILKDQGHTYEILMLDRTKASAYQSQVNFKKQFLFGPVLMKEKSATFINKWENKYKQAKQIAELMKQGENIDIDTQNQLHTRLRWMEELLNE